MGGRPARPRPAHPCLSPDSVDDGDFLLPSLPMHLPPARRCAPPLATSRRPAAGGCGSHVCLRWRSLRIRHVPSRGPQNPTGSLPACSLLPYLAASLMLQSRRLRLGVLRSTVMLAPTDRSACAEVRTPPPFPVGLGAKLSLLFPTARKEPCFPLLPCYRRLIHTPLSSSPTSGPSNSALQRRRPRRSSIFIPTCPSWHQPAVTYVSQRISHPLTNPLTQPPALSSQLSR